MKNIAVILAFLISNSFFSQDDPVNIKDDSGLKKIAVSSSPSQMLLDNAPSIISVQPYVKAYNLNLNNIDDLSFDITPLLINKKFNGWQYYGYYDNFERYNSFNNLLKATFSLSVKKEADYSNATIGFRTNVITIYSINKDEMKKNFDIFKDSLKIKNQKFKVKATNEILKKYKLELDECTESGDNCIRKLLKDKRHEIQQLAMKYIDNESDISKFDFYKVLNNPKLSLDVAAAYNHVFENKEFSNNYQGRVGAWATLKFSQSLDPKTYDSFINAYLFSRYLKDNHYFNSDTQLFSNMNFVDYGARLQVEFKKFSLSYEFIKREGDLSDERSVGLVTYKINQNLYLNGGFGKNFEGINGNSFTLLGIAWGINSNNQSLDWN
ncbi:hypothetical protein [Chryseobacterium limigenitum]|uniref:Uncharacterized protein n=1 Tax=Chryseobacterium limigenitum TaxID=1612149 RepID=A0A1K2ICH2_9FLAO|nr:hypothetical protein [Chryseobacterium limigenitum]SFZ90095.1 hypothetical protein SAMN05216324_101208 [Chryseobacterium limigenitum]